MTFAGWRERVERELAGVAFDRALVTDLPGGLRIQPLYEGGVSTLVAPDANTRPAVLVLAGGSASERIGEGAIWCIGDAGTGDVLERHDGEVTHLTEGATVAAHALDVHDAGGSVPLEVGVALARWLDALREGRVETPIAAAVGTEIFVEIAKLRALRLLAHRAGRALLDASARVRVISRTSLVPFSRIEPETNALRATLSAVAALVGGSELHATASCDVLSGGGAQTARRADRLASATSLVASLESHLGDTADAAHGSHLVEALTLDIARAAWAVTRDLEAQGGAARAPDRWRSRLADEGRARATAAAAGKLPRVGATRLARHDAPLAPAVVGALAHVVRDAAPFESIRDERLARPTTILVAGDARRTSARADYLRDVLACWGAPTEIVRFVSVEAALEALGASAASITADAVAVVVEDADLERLGPLVHTLSRGRGVLVAGRPGQNETGLRAAGARAFVHLGCDLARTARIFFASTPTARHSQPPRGAA